MAEDTDRIRKIDDLIHGLLTQVRIGSLGTLRESPAQGEWNAIQILAHVAEFVPFWAKQARLLAERDDGGAAFGRSTVNPEEDPERLAAVERYGSYARGAVIDVLERGLAQAREDIHSIQPDRWSRTGRHADGTVRTVAQVVDELIIDHLAAHSHQMENTIPPDDD